MQRWSVLAAPQRSDAQLGADPGEYHSLFSSDQELLDLLEFGFRQKLLTADNSYRAPPDEVPTTSGRTLLLVCASALDPLEQDILLHCLLPETNLKYARFLAYIQDEVIPKRPMVDLLLNLPYMPLAELVAMRSVTGRARQHAAGAQHKLGRPTMAPTHWRALRHPCTLTGPHTPTASRITATELAFRQPVSAESVDRVRGLFGCRCRISRYLAWPSRPAGRCWPPRDWTARRGSGACRSNV
jgi:hypothetical protein